ncbi:cytochrome C biogenesis protein ResB [Saccharomonospora piscinae]|uniref:Cytochrome C biogenesis protein ResB n=1 Tax=Saccharomonospora piscinae TaxID=687388 RepID=A0A1V9A1F3_SACPI|nr:cytochrome c biogenesis protein ResB [Saccharomonospora piscinae]OQO90969.1 cytochrome C biogenesis protein ResB [Saccharomonospora piscinae]
MTHTETASRPTPPRPNPHRTPLRRALAFVRNTWRGLTSMRTALVLLFLLALAALPGALLPQWDLNAEKTRSYITEHGWWGQLLDRLQLFDVYSSVWFSAVYLLLMVSLIGCLVPRTGDYVRAMRAGPVRTPRNLSRLPHHMRTEVAAAPDDVVATARRRLRGWRVAERTEADGARTLSAERGYLRETGNLVFHFGMLGIVIAFAGGALYSYEGQVIVHADGQEFCNSGIFAYDSFNPGLRVDGTGLTPFCVRVDDFEPTYTDAGQPISYDADIRYQSGADLESGTWREHHLEVNEPLRTEGDRVYLLGHGYAPTFTVTWPDGESRTQTIQWRPTDQTTLLSQGATKFDPPGITDAEVRRDNQLAVTGLFAPTAALHGNILTSAFPNLTDPAAAVDVMRGDLGIDSGQPQSIFEIDQSMVDSGRLERVARENLRVGESVTLDDGTRVSFDGVRRWVSLQVSHDPTQGWMLGFAIAMFVGLGASLAVKRRRFWVRVTPAGDAGNDLRRSVVELGGLARTDQAGYGEEFSALARDVLDRTPRERKAP